MSLGWKVAIGFMAFVITIHVAFFAYQGALVTYGCSQKADVCILTRHAP
jgi:hypothetical protein